MKNDILLLTGASGFLGKSLLEYFSSKKFRVRPVYRSNDQLKESGNDDAVLIPGLEEDVDWQTALNSVSVVIHAAARAHAMNDEAIDPLSEYRKINVYGTLNLAQQAAKAGVKRFIFISSIKVNGESTSLGKPFKADDIPSPEDAYGISKAEAEAGLWQISHETGMELVIIRPVLVYGQGVKGNFSKIISLIRRGLPLPFGCVNDNKRSFVGLDNLVNLIEVCVSHPKAANQIFLASDGHDVSTRELMRNIADAIQSPLYLIPIPVFIMNLGLTLFGKKMVVQRLMGSLQVDIEKNQRLLGWSPPFSLKDGLRKMLREVN